MKRIDPDGNRPIHLSLDVDGIDPVHAPGTGTCCRGGLSLREIRYICTELANTGRLVSMDLVEVEENQKSQILLLIDVIQIVFQTYFSKWKRFNFQIFNLVQVNPLLDEPPTVMHGDDENLTLMSTLFDIPNFNFDLSS